MGTTWPVELRQYSILRLVICSRGLHVWCLEQGPVPALLLRVPATGSGEVSDVVMLYRSQLVLILIRMVLLIPRSIAPAGKRAKAATILVIVGSLHTIRTFLCSLLLLEGC